MLNSCAYLQSYEVTEAGTRWFETAFRLVVSADICRGFFVSVFVYVCCGLTLLHGLAVRLTDTLSESLGFKHGLRVFFKQKISSASVTSKGETGISKKMAWYRLSQQETRRSTGHSLITDIILKQY